MTLLLPRDNICRPHHAVYIPSSRWPFPSNLATPQSIQTLIFIIPYPPSLGKQKERRIKRIGISIIRYIRRKEKQRIARMARKFFLRRRIERMKRIGISIIRDIRRKEKQRIAQITRKFLLRRRMGRMKQIIDDVRSLERSYLALPTSPAAPVPRGKEETAT